MSSKTSFEHKACGRCGGTGQFGPLSVMSGVCFGCGGRGWKFTKRGQAAHEMFAASLRKPVAELNVGDRVHIESTPLPGMGNIGGGWGTVERIDEHDDGARTIRVDHGNAMPTTLNNWTRPVRVSHTADDKRELIEAALAFEATLTKAGTPRKRAAAKAGA